MHLVVIGLNHRSAPVEVREKLSISEDQLPQALASLKSLDTVRECLILSTCNRTEVYACTTSHDAEPEIVSRIGEICEIPVEEFSTLLYVHRGHKAAEHLFRVASGIDSMVIGEPQILGQIKSAYNVTMGAGCTDTILNNLFQQAISVGKRVRTETEIGRGAFSVGYVAVRLARSIFSDLKGHTILLVGAGKMGELIATHLISSGADQMLVANRTHERAVDLAGRLRGKAVAFDCLSEALASADIVITSTGADKPLLTRDLVLPAMRARRGKPVFFIDIAVPRDVEPGVGDLDNVFVYDIDDLQSVVEADLLDRQSEIAKAEAIVAEEVGAFNTWFRMLDAVPVITALRERLEEIRASEMEKLAGKLEGLTPEQIEAINAATRSIVNKICHQPMLQMKEYASNGGSDSLDLICELFGICPSRPEDEGK